MDELLELLEDIKPTVDFRTCTGLIDDGYLDSFDILSIVSELNDAFGIEISPVDIIPENFNSAQALWDMVERLNDN
ncbi:MAG: acyl carrier protein [Clostridia bacterium]|nr:acyl carrier protein [Clostridia bacterium]